jgi:hypothetical protein
MIMDESTYFATGVQTFVETLKSKAFRSRVAKIGNYDFRDSGKIMYSSPRKA